MLSLTSVCQQHDVEQQMHAVCLCVHACMVGCCSVSSVLTAHAAWDEERLPCFVLACGPTFICVPSMQVWLQQYLSVQTLCNTSSLCSSLPVLLAST